jgi:hypothetical protein
MKYQGTELATARLDAQRLDDLRRWVELDRQHQQLIEGIHTQSIPGHEASQQLDTLWHEKALIADRLLSALTPQWFSDDGSLYLPLPTHVAMPKAEPKRLGDGSLCQSCGTVDEDKPRQWVHNKLTGYKYLCPSCEASQPDINQPGVFERFLKRLHL